MKKTDIAMIILIATVSVGIAYFVANSIFGNVAEEGVKVRTIDPITSTVETPDSKIFNDNAINPSIEVNITNTEDTPAVTGEASGDTTNSAQ